MNKIYEQLQFSFRRMRNIWADTICSNFLDIRTPSMGVATVRAVQVDNTLNPGTSIEYGRSYILTDVSNLHANFIVPADVADNDIVTWTGRFFTITMKAADATAKGLVVKTYVTSTNEEYVFSGSSWSVSGGNGDLLRTDFVDGDIWGVMDNADPDLAKVFNMSGYKNILSGVTQYFSRNMLIDPVAQLQCGSDSLQIVDDQEADFGAATHTTYLANPNGNCSSWVTIDENGVSVAGIRADNISFDSLYIKTTAIYADLAAITAAIATPTAGMMVIVTGQGQAYYTGVAWVLTSDGTTAVT